MCDDIAIGCDAVRSYRFGCCKRNSSHQTLIHPARSADRVFLNPTGGQVVALFDPSGVNGSARTLSSKTHSFESSSA